MERDGQLSTYKSYDVSKNTERQWLREHQKELITQIQTGNSIDVYISRLCSVMRQSKDGEYLDSLINALSKSIKNADTFVQLRIAEELLEVIKFFALNDIRDWRKLASHKSLAIDILKNVLSQPITISYETRKKVVFEDTLKEENIRERIKQRLKEFE